MTDTFYTVQEVARMLKIHERTVLNLIARKEIHAVKVANTYRISQEALDDYIKRHS
jgi:excisionase family DNA binding protein